MPASVLNNGVHTMCKGGGMDWRGTLLPTRLFVELCTGGIRVALLAARYAINIICSWDSISD